MEFSYVLPSYFHSCNYGQTVPWVQTTIFVSGTSTQALKSACEFISSHQQQLRKLSSLLKAEPLNFLFSVIHSNSQSLLYISLTEQFTSNRIIFLNSEHFKS